MNSHHRLTRRRSRSRSHYCCHCRRHCGHRRLAMVIAIVIIDRVLLLQRCLLCLLFGIIGCILALVVTLSLNGNWLCCSNLIMLLYFHLIWLCYIFSIIRHVIIICRVSRWKSYFIAFHIYKVGVGFTSRSESTRHPFGNDAYFGQPENGDQRVLSGYGSFCVSFVCGFASITRCSPSHRYWACDRRTTELAAEITNRSYMRASVNR
jgi:hypothetical protein